MANFTPGVGGTITSTTWEKVVVELAQILQNTEEAQNALLTAPINRIALNYESGNPKVATLQVNMPLTLALSTDGIPQTVAAPFLSPAYSYAAGTGGDLKSTTLEAAMLEAAFKLQALEKAPVAVGATAPDNNVTITIDTENLVAAINATLPISFSVTGGLPVIEAVSYL
jgi:hypothetical protein